MGQTFIKQYLYSDQREETNDVLEYEIETEESHIIENKLFKHKEKKALLIGINYKDNSTTDDDLYGCVNDCFNIRKKLNNMGFKDENIIMLINSDATKSNIKSQINNLVNLSQKKELDIWFSYSGHGGGSFSYFEKDNQKEYICPDDYLVNGMIDDVWLKTNFVDKLSPKTNCFVLMDCCHSGSNFNLPYQYPDVNLNTNSICNIIKISGCRDNQYSMDAFDNKSKTYQGALTNQFLSDIKEDSILNIYQKVKKNLKNNNFSQIPNLTYSDYDLIHCSL